MLLLWVGYFFMINNSLASDTYEVVIKNKKSYIFGLIWGLLTYSIISPGEFKKSHVIIAEKINKHEKKIIYTGYTINAEKILSEIENDLELLSTADFEKEYLV